MAYKNKEDQKKYLRNYYRKNKEKIRSKSKQYYEEHKEEAVEYRKAYQQEHKEEIAIYNKEYNRLHAEKMKQYCRDYKLRNKDKINACREKPKYRFTNAKLAARRRGLEFLLMLDDYLLIIEQPCYYCNGFFPAVRVGSGLDRVDNKIGYITENVVSCCKFCNNLKRDVLTSEETKAAINAIISLRKN